MGRHKIHTFVAYLKKKKLKNLTTPIFLVGLIYRWGYGAKNQKYMYKCDFFLHNMCKKKKKKFLTFFDFFDFLGRKYDFLGLIQHFINIFVTKWIKKKKKSDFFLLFLTFCGDNVTFLESR